MCFRYLKSIHKLLKNKKRDKIQKKKKKLLYCAFDEFKIMHPTEHGVNFRVDAHSFFDR